MNTSTPTPTQTQTLEHSLHGTSSHVALDTASICLTACPSSPMPTCRLALRWNTSTDRTQNIHKTYRITVIHSQILPRKSPLSPRQLPSIVNQPSPALTPQPHTKH